MTRKIMKMWFPLHGEIPDNVEVVSVVKQDYFEDDWCILCWVIVSTKPSKEEGR